MELKLIFYILLPDWDKKAKTNYFSYVLKPKPLGLL